jgi:hypothetical protein
MFIGLVSLADSKISLYPTIHVNHAVLAMHAEWVPELVYLTPNAIIVDHFTKRGFNMAMVNPRLAVQGTVTVVPAHYQPEPRTCQCPRVARCSVVLGLGEW